MQQWQRLKFVNIRSLSSLGGAQNASPDGVTEGSTPQRRDYFGLRTLNIKVRRHLQHLRDGCRIPIPSNSERLSPTLDTEPPTSKARYFRRQSTMSISDDVQEMLHLWSEHGKHSD